MGLGSLGLGCSGLGLDTMMGLGACSGQPVGPTKLRSDASFADDPQPWTGVVRVVFFASSSLMVTWSNNQDFPSWSRIDRFLVSPVPNDFQGGRTYFTFENMWLKILRVLWIW